MLAGVLALAGAAVELAKAEVAVGSERAHAELVSQRQRLSIAALGVLDMGRVGVRRDLAEGAKAPGFETALTALADEPEGLVATRVRLVEPAGEQVGLGKIGDDERLVVCEPERLVQAD